MFEQSGRLLVPNSRTHSFERADYRHPAAGWGAARSVERALARTHEPRDAELVIEVERDDPRRALLVEAM
jgi:hypothetical protein